MSKKYKDLYYKYNDEITDITDIGKKNKALRFPFFGIHIAKTFFLTSILVVICCLSFVFFSVFTMEWLSYLFLNIATGYVVTLILFTISERRRKLELFYNESIPTLKSAISQTYNGIDDVWLKLEQTFDVDEYFLYAKVLANTFITVENFVQMLSKNLEKKNFKNYYKYSLEVNEFNMDLFSKKIDPLYIKDKGEFVKKMPVFTKDLFDLRLKIQSVLALAKSELEEVEDKLEEYIYGK